MFEKFRNFPSKVLQSAILYDTMYAFESIVVLFSVEPVCREWVLPTLYC